MSFRKYRFLVNYQGQAINGSTNYGMTEFSALTKKWSSGDILEARKQISADPSITPKMNYDRIVITNIIRLKNNKKWLRNDL